LISRKSFGINLITDDKYSPLKNLKKKLDDSLIPEKRTPKEKKKESDTSIYEDLRATQNKTALSWFVVSVMYIVLVVTVSMHRTVQAYQSNFVGIFFLIAFGFVFVFNFVGLSLHRLETFLHEVAISPYFPKVFFFGCPNTKIPKSSYCCSWWTVECFS